MTSRYRVEYALKQHRRDEFIEWIKGVLAGPFVLHAVKSSGITVADDMKISADARRRYAEVFSDIERLVDDQIFMYSQNTPEFSRLKQLVPSVGEFFTQLPLEKAFYIEDEKRSISKRRLVCPSFNDVRVILNTAQLLQLSGNFNSVSIQEEDKLQLITFDGDVTLYDDGDCLMPDSPLIPLIIQALSRNFFIGIVTAAGYKDGAKYYERLYGLIDALELEIYGLTERQKERFLVMGGEANYLLQYDSVLKKLKFIEPSKWILPAMAGWNPINITNTLDFAESVLSDLIRKLELPAIVVKKERAVGMVAKPGFKLLREALEEVVLICDNKLNNFQPAQEIEFCAFNGGSDVWVDIGDKSLGVKVLQTFLGKDAKSNSTLHIGDQFATVGANDYKARRSACTVWIANPEETRNCLVDLFKYIDNKY
ncbi:hypothetical protein PACTADRAFT_81594 [Pachysolen tannophilus NRRL Y-2460]|uniref:IMP-specific 5'-nucleotidase 1 n=1 Tax=Pachysolen tannophilus NRRL Y-2460 TaxID=669874 RepID=A0A1E4TTI9_PACTA|nr:hypothetical protein PACTADRAFT_81594 [Pachysolen tannophilus NRRL Y-2460]